MKSAGATSVIARGMVALAALLGTMLIPLSASRADQGGISFWLPGAFGSMAAVPGHPGWSLGTIYLHSSTSAGGDVAASRAIRFGDRTTNLNVNLNAVIGGDLDALVLAPGYTFATPVLGGQFAMNMLAIFGRVHAQIDATVSGALGPIGFETSRSVSDNLVGYGDLFPQFTLKWNEGVHNLMVYGMMNLPIGSYNPKRLANLGLGHWALDGGAGYTYFNPQTGHEFSVVTGFTYNFINPYLDYQNGIDWHLDWSLSKFLTKQVQIGLVGYAFNQLTGDSGGGATLGDFKSRVFGVGPQIGYLFPVSDMQGYLNLKAYGDFGAKHRAEGWNLWLTFAVSPAAPAPPPPRHLPLK